VPKLLYSSTNVKSIKDKESWIKYHDYG